MRVALIEASHWHVPLYLGALAESGVEVVGVSDADGGRGADVARRLGAPLYASYEELLRRERVDFAFAFGRHTDMPRIAEALIARGVPFAIEKPCGTRASEVARIRRLADERGVYVAVPFILRLSDFLREIARAEEAAPSAFHHMSFRCIAGPPARYSAAGCSWMLDPSIAGGGPLINVGVHVVDLFLLLSCRPVRTVRCLATSRPFGSAIEEYAALTLATDDGTIGVLEAGYTFPGSPTDKRELSFSLSSQSNYYRSGNDTLEIHARAQPEGRREVRPVHLDTDIYYPLFVKHVLAECRSNAAPRVGLREAEAVMHVVDAAYASAREGGAPVTVAALGDSA